MLIFVAMIAFLSVRREASAQSIATTTEETLTRVTVATESTVQVGNTVTKTLSYSDADFIPPSTTMTGISGTNYCGVYYHLKFFAVAGQRIFGQLSANLPINFYVMSSAQYTSWVNLKSCQVSDALLRREDMTTYSLDWSASQSGPYYFMFLNENDNSATVSFGPQTSSVAMQYYTIYSLSTETTTLLQTYKIALVAIDQTASYLIILLGVAIASIELVRVRRSPPITRRLRKCPNCGQKNPNGTNFCGNCATTLRQGEGGGMTRDEVQPY